MATLPLSVTPDERAEKRRKKRELKMERRYLADTLKVTQADIEYALFKFKGSLAKAAEFLGTTRDVLARKVQMSPALSAVQKRIKAEKVDLAEFKLAEQVEQGYFPAIAMTLKTLGQDRGYTERSTVEHELSDKAIRDAAGLIEAMKRGMVSVEERPLLEDKEEIWGTVGEVVEVEIPTLES